MAATPSIPLASGLYIIESLSQVLYISSSLYLYTKTHPCPCPLIVTKGHPTQIIFFLISKPYLPNPISSPSDIFRSAASASLICKVATNMFERPSSLTVYTKTTLVAPTTTILSYTAMRLAYAIPSP